MHDREPEREMAEKTKNSQRTRGLPGVSASMDRDVSDVMQNPPTRAAWVPAQRRRVRGEARSYDLQTSRVVPEQGSHSPMALYLLVM
jgi:hypothetical protein